MLFWVKLFIKRDEDLIMNFDIPSVNDLIETAEGGKNGFLKILINFWEFKCVLAQFTTCEYDYMYKKK